MACRGQCGTASQYVYIKISHLLSMGIIECKDNTKAFLFCENNKNKV